MSPADIERIAHLLAGTEPGWQTRFGTLTGLSRTHVSQLLSGVRPLTQRTLVAIISAAQRQSKVFRERADEIDAALQAMPTMAEFAQLPRGDAQHEGDDE